MSDWVTDSQLYEAEGAVQAKFAEAWELLVAMEIELPSTAMVGLRECLRPSPESVLAECERLRHAYRLHIDDVPFDVQIGTAIERLSEWSGSAAESFRNRLRAVQSVQEQQTAFLEEALVHSTALLGLVIGTRTSFHKLASETIAELDKELGLSDTRSAKAFIGIGTDLIKEALSLDPAKILTGAISALVGVAKNLLDLAVEGNDFEEILTRYRDCGDAIRRQYEAGLTDLATKFQQETQEVVSARTNLEDPLPQTTDIHSPDFRYENFASSSVSTPEFDQKVEAEREKYVAEQESEINRRLGGGG